MRKNDQAFRVAMLGVLVALNVIAAEILKFKIIPNVLELSFGFVPLAVAGMLFGPVEAMLVGIVGDVFGALIFPHGPFYLGFTLTAALTGLFYGLFLHAQADGKKRVIRAMIAQLLVSLICYAGFNTLWTWLMGYGRNEGYIFTRLVVNAVVYPIYTLVLLLIWRYRKNLERAVRA